nr:MAG TPA: hypothetical protein [Crassvirales sp.]
MEQLCINLYFQSLHLFSLCHFVAAILVVVFK